MTEQSALNRGDNVIDSHRHGELNASRVLVKEAYGQPEHPWSSNESTLSTASLLPGLTLDQGSKPNGDTVNNAKEKCIIDLDCPELPPKDKPSFPKPTRPDKPDSKDEKQKDGADGEPQSEIDLLRKKLDKKRQTKNKPGEDFGI